MKVGGPQVKRVSEITRTKLIPALADGQMGLAIDAKLKSKHFIDKLPPTPESMPMAEPALVLGVSDAALLRQAIAEYCDAANAIFAALHEANAEVPALKVPPPVVSKSANGEIFGYVLPKEWGVDGQIFPNAGLSDKFAVLSISRAHTERLLAEQPLGFGGVFSADPRPLGAAGGCDWPGFMDVLRPWADLATQLIVKGQGDDEETIEKRTKEVLDQVHTVLDVLKVLRGCTSQTYAEGDALVTHSEMEIRDLPAEEETHEEK